MLTGAIGAPDPRGRGSLAGGGPCTLVCLRAGRLDTGFRSPDPNVNRNRNPNPVAPAAAICAPYSRLAG